MMKRALIIGLALAFSLGAAFGADKKVKGPDKRILSCPVICAGELPKIRHYAPMYSLLRANWGKNYRVH